MDFDIVSNFEFRASDLFFFHHLSIDKALESPPGQEVYRKEITGISIASGTEQTLSETFIFHPIEKGRYVLKYRYWDETKEKPLSCG